MDSQPLTAELLLAEIDKVRFSRVSAVKVNRSTYMDMWMMTEEDSPFFFPDILQPLSHVQVLIDDSVPRGVLQPFSWL